MNSIECGFRMEHLLKQAAGLGISVIYEGRSVRLVPGTALIDEWGMCEDATLEYRVESIEELTGFLNGWATLARFQAITKRGSEA